jgi:hypothetical protein
LSSAAAASSGLPLVTRLANAASRESISFLACFTSKESEAVPRLMTLRIVDWMFSARFGSPR